MAYEEAQLAGQVFKAPVVDGLNVLGISIEDYNTNWIDVQGYPVFIDYEHHRLHEGRTYHALDVQASIGTGTVKYAFVTGAAADDTQIPHLVLGANVYNGAVRLDIYEGATYSGGTALAGNNRHRTSSNVAASTAVWGVTSTDGTLIDSFYVGGGMFTSGNARADSEWNLKPETTYRIDMIGQGANTQAIISFEWYEGSNS